LTEDSSRNIWIGTDNGLSRYDKKAGTFTKSKINDLLLNILPAEVAEELKEKGFTTAKAFDDVTVMFTA
jgi:ligand-binding sensor domain-containing protein